MSELKCDCAVSFFSVSIEIFCLEGDISLFWLHVNIFSSQFVYESHSIGSERNNIGAKSTHVSMNIA